jgi:hypothetical protein
MYKSLAGMAAAAVLTTVVASSPANAFAVRHAPGVAQDQATVEQVQWGYGYPRRYYRYGYPYRYGYGYPYRYRAYPYAYAAPYPYPYYRRHYYYGPRPFIGIGPVGIGVW